MSSPSFFAPASRRSVRSAPLYDAMAATAAVGSTASAGAAPTRRLKPQQASRIFAQDLVLLPRGQVLAGANRGDGVRIFGIEVRIVARHEDMVLPELRDRPLEVVLVGFAGDVAVAPDVFRGGHLEMRRDLREVLRPFPVVVHAVHPVE